MSVIPTVWCPYCDSANELNAKRCWHCKQRIPVEAARTATDETMATLPALPAATGLPPSCPHQRVCPRRSPPTTCGML
jgi:hypothetical protein